MAVKCPVRIDGVAAYSACQCVEVRGEVVRVTLSRSITRQHVDMHLLSLCSETVWRKLRECRANHESWCGSLTTLTDRPEQRESNQRTVVDDAHISESWEVVISNRGTWEPHGLT
jgi:hypothetical protein